MKRALLLLYSASFALLALSTTSSAWARNPKKSVAQSGGITSSTSSIYENLLEEQTQLGNLISTLTLQLHTASPAKAKKITKEINHYSDELAAVERTMASFPAAQTGAAVPVSSINPKDDPFLQELDAFAAKYVANSNPFAGQLSTDPELDRMYRAYLKTHGGDVPAGVVADQPTSYNNKSYDNKSSNNLTYRVMVAISKTRLPATKFSGLTDVMEQAMPEGGYVYYAGSYTSKNEAQSACEQILSRHKFRDAFVVAMDGNRRVQIGK